MNIIVCGGRDFADPEWLNQVLDYLNGREPIRLLRQGGQMMRHPDDAKLPAQKQRRIGADYLAKRWAISRMVNHDQVDADWKRFGAAAGPIRNGMMLRPGDIHMVVGFPRMDGSLGDGTADMLKKARDMDIRTIEVVRRADLAAMRSPAEPPPAPAPASIERAIPLADPAALKVVEPTPPPQLTLI